MRRVAKKVVMSGTLALSDRHCSELERGGETAQLKRFQLAGEHVLSPVEGGRHADEVSFRLQGGQPRSVSAAGG
jgi:hypothetical protein